MNAYWNDPNPWSTGYLRIEGKADRCPNCKACEQICPQKLEISSFMKEAASLFKG